jgi:hypothetical protein
MAGGLAHPAEKARLSAVFLYSRLKISPSDGAINLSATKTFHWPTKTRITAK